ncbi:MAG: DEAD/DEAH box helicase, partial [Desulfofundulus sp.]
IRVGCHVQVTGKIERRFGEIQLLVNDYELLQDDDAVPRDSIVPVYPLTGQLTQRLMRSLVCLALDEWMPRVKDFLPPGLRQKFSLPELPIALRQIHFPATEKEAIRARKRFIFEELFLLQLVLALRRGQTTRKVKPHRYHEDDELVERFLSTLPFTLTPSQQLAWEEIKADMDASWPMNRLLQGDVGSGKTVVSTLALLRAVGSGLQGVLMAPTEILAEQHYLTLSRSLVPLGIKVGLLSGNLKKG